MSTICTSYARQSSLVPQFFFLKETKDKIRNLFPKLIPALFSGHFFSSKEFYETAEITLLSSSLIGMIGSFCLLIAGMPGVSLFVVALSITTATGAYLASQASLQQTLIDSANQMKEQTEDLKKENETLKKAVSKLSLQISQFDLQLAHLKTLNEEFQKELLYFHHSNEKNTEAFTKKIEDFSTQISAFATLWNELLKESKYLRNDLSLQIGNLKQIIQEMTDPKSTLVKLEEHRKIREQINDALICLKKTQEKIEEIKREIALRDGQLSERDRLFQELRKDHFEILASYKKQLKEFMEQIWIFKTLLDTFKKS